MNRQTHRSILLANPRSWYDQGSIQQRWDCLLLCIAVLFLHNRYKCK